MQPDEDLTARFDGLRALFDKHLEVRAPTLEQAIHRAGRQVPRRLRAPAARLVQAEQFAAHPKLMRRINHAEAQADVQALSAYLKTQDMAQERTTRRLNALAGAAFNLLVVGGLFIAVLRWRGFV